MSLFKNSLSGNHPILDNRSAQPVHIFHSTIEYPASSIEHHLGEALLMALNPSIADPFTAVSPEGINS